MSHIGFSTIDVDDRCILKCLHLVLDFKTQFRIQQWYWMYNKVYIQGVSKKVPTLVLLIARLLKHLKNWFCTFLNSPAFAESKNNYVFILGLKLKKLLTKNVVRTPYLKWWVWIIWCTLLFLHFRGFQDTLKKGFVQL